MGETWKTAITSIKPNEVRVRGYDIADLMGRVSFGAAAYLIVRGELPPEPVARLMDAILVSSIDHGVTPPSCNAARTAASTGASLSAGVAAGLLAINRWHGGAIQDCASRLGELLDKARTAGVSVHDAPQLEAVAREHLAEMKLRSEKMSGFGHRVHTSDPRTARLMELAEAAGVAGDHVRAARAVEAAFASAGKPLPINVDGAIGAILADLGFDHAAMNGVFMMARVPGLVAHVVEEQRREKPMRRIDASAAEYDGPAPRSVR